MQFRNTTALILSAIYFATGAAAVSCAVCAPTIFYAGLTRTLTLSREEGGNTVQCKKGNFDRLLVATTPRLSQDFLLPASIETSMESSSSRTPELALLLYHWFRRPGAKDKLKVGSVAHNLFHHQYKPTNLNVPTFSYV
ncbi:hypothetical protein GALMADRAFT_215891 [Galerina marginata CBS 339.88]|uniref:Uncharacterized protein n=1 Tax=Galerina marginata (strain CBS 339.88) TaxID=685588 RepID=A0A067SKC4_GALM3|nr:hypothetical protein GALMADRAFT_215891 [Galerina marginata CBS 339.88]